MSDIEHYQVYVHGDDGTALAGLLDALTTQGAEWKLTYYVNGRPMHTEGYSKEVTFVPSRKAPHHTILERLKRVSS
jgi:hypothetical protein